MVDASSFSTAQWFRSRAARSRPVASASSLPSRAGHSDHSITSSAIASNEGGISRPRAFAVLRLITSSNWVG